MNVEQDRETIEAARQAVRTALNPLINALGGDVAAAFLVAGGAVKFLGQVLAFIEASGIDSAHHRQLMINMMDETRANLGELSKATLQ